MDVVLDNATGLGVRLADDPLTCVARGTAVYLENIELWKDILESDEEM
jgi:rod shape-determining protein MreB